MSSSKTSSASAENFDNTCVIISNLRKFEGVQRHIDTILHQIIPRLGPVAYCEIFKRGTIHDREITTGFIQLEDKDNHRLLQRILNGYNFHPDTYADTYNDYKYKFETEVKGDFNFQFIDDDYTPTANQLRRMQHFSSIHDSKHGITNFKYKNAYSNNNKHTATNKTNTINGKSRHFETLQTRGSHSNTENTSKQNKHKRR